PVPDVGEHARRTLPAAVPAAVPTPAGGAPGGRAVGDRRLPARPPRLLPATRRPGRGVFPLLRGRRFLPAGAAARVGGGLRAGGGGDAPLAAAHPGGAGPAAAGDPARAVDLRPQALAAVAG